MQSFPLLLCIFIVHVEVGQKTTLKSPFTAILSFSLPQSFPFDLMRLFGLPFVYGLMCVCVFFFCASKIFVCLKSLRYFSESFMFDFVFFQHSMYAFFLVSNTRRMGYNEIFEWVRKTDYYLIGFNVQIHTE